MCLVSGRDIPGTLAWGSKPRPATTTLFLEMFTIVIETSSEDRREIACFSKRTRQTHVKTTARLRPKLDHGRKKNS